MNFDPHTQVPELRIGDDGSSEIHYVDAPAGYAYRPKTLDDLRADKLGQVKAWRDEARATFVWDGSVFDLNVEAELRLAEMRRDALAGSFVPEMWRLADNSWREIGTGEDAIAIYTAGRDHLRRCFQRFAQLEVLVADATTKDELDRLAWVES